MSELTDTLRKAARDIAEQGHFGWGNSSSDAADRIEHLERVLAQSRDALSIALSDVEWRASSPTQKVIFKAHAAIDEALK